MLCLTFCLCSGILDRKTNCGDICQFTCYTGLFTSSNTVRKKSEKRRLFKRVQAFYEEKVLSQCWQA